MNISSLTLFRLTTNFKMGNCLSLCKGNQKDQRNNSYGRTCLLHSEQSSSTCSCHSEQTFLIEDPSKDEQEILSKIVLRTSEQLIDMYTLTSEKLSLPNILEQKPNDLRQLEQLVAPETNIFNGLIRVGITRREQELLENTALLVKKAIQQAKMIKDVGQIVIKLNEFEEIHK
ncbi:hypothetical protein PCK1_000624 [Pneumocystis canis]|nr:hypothetical protein PCK1_000624 [Pneumocystis canis]